jgi:hypothetical protein
MGLHQTGNLSIKPMNKDELEQQIRDNFAAGTLELSFSFS